MIVCFRLSWLKPYEQCRRGMVEQEQQPDKEYKPYLTQLSKEFEEL
jgi:hypothetical protein